MNKPHFRGGSRISSEGGGGVLNKITPSGGRHEIFWGISCEKSRFYAKKSYFFQLWREARNCLGYFVWKITNLRQKIIFFPIVEGGAKLFGVFRVKNHEFTPKNHICSNSGGRREIVWGISCEKSWFYANKSYFFQLWREARNCLGYFVWKITILRQKIIFFPI
jgi:hypothetical protein